MEMYAAAVIGLIGLVLKLLLILAACFAVWRLAGRKTAIRSFSPTTHLMIGTTAGLVLGWWLL
jgi:hypothetical protein